MKAALIATGNEIVSGQILNTNTSWLASKLSEKGLDIHYHMGVLDKSEDLVKSLNWLKEQSMDHVFISGGLGPTRDDLTRQVVADYCSKDFEFNETRWNDLEKALLSRKITPRDGHKWQCYFPKGSKALINSVGTAWGFQTETADKKMKIWTLPGPPVEFQDVFKNSIEPWMDENAKPQTELVTWQCFNTPESEVAHITEEALDGCGYEIGYRASPPITEVKLWVPIDELENNKWCAILDELFKDFLYSKNSTDYLKKVLDSFSQDEYFEIFDELTEGDLLNQVKDKYSDICDRLEYSKTHSKKHLTKGMQFYLTKSGVSLELVNKEQTDFHEEMSLDLLKKSKRARKYALAKLIKKAALYLER